jgi:hypothetical protein
MAIPTAEQIKQYLATRGVKCLFCLSSDIEGGSVEIDNGGAYQPINCLACDETWTDSYKLTGVTNA